MENIALEIDLSLFIKMKNITSRVVGGQIILKNLFQK